MQWLVKPGSASMSAASLLVCSVPGPVAITAGNRLMSGSSALLFWGILVPSSLGLMGGCTFPCS